ncbi:GNAT family N-acetyltransferase, partial [Klebsiella pneumoniae]|uniref:GNAT family N-acetyltransferase n=1 Tax=Klebsiella pneumoniae TaxID=573 RepID=UPI00385209CF
ECEGKAYGFGRLDLLTGEIASLYVLPEASGMGIGTKMLTALLFEAKKSSPREVWLNAALNAVPFYLAQGFSEVESIDYL